MKQSKKRLLQSGQLAFIKKTLKMIPDLAIILLKISREIILILNSFLSLSARPGVGKIKYKFTASSPLLSSPLLSRPAGLTVTGQTGCVLTPNYNWREGAEPPGPLPAFVLLLLSYWLLLQYLSIINNTLTDLMWLLCPLISDTQYLIIQLSQYHSITVTQKHSNTTVNFINPATVVKVKTIHHEVPLGVRLADSIWLNSVRNIYILLPIELSTAGQESQQFHSPAAAGTLWGHNLRSPSFSPVMLWFLTPNSFRMFGRANGSFNHQNWG